MDLYLHQLAAFALLLHVKKLRNVKTYSRKRTNSKTLLRFLTLSRKIFHQLTSFVSN